MPGNWRKPSYSNASGNCLEAGNTAGRVVVRDSRDRDGPVLVFAPGQWREFTATVKGS